MEKGKMLGKGMTAEVYQWGQDKILKLFWENYNDEFIKREVLISEKIHDAGIPSPAVYGIVEVDGRMGIVFQKINGKTIASSLMREPWQFVNFVKQMARFQFEIHKHSIEGIPTLKERFTSTIMRSSEILGDKAERILNYIDMLPEGDSLCHGDFYLSNIILSNNKFVAIDFSTSYKGNPLADVAQTCMIINSQAAIPRMPSIVADMARYPKWMTCEMYMNEYMKIAKADYEGIDAWMLPVAAARLKDKIPGEVEWLMKIIDKRLKQLD